MLQWRQEPGTLPTSAAYRARSAATSALGEGTTRLPIARGEQGRVLSHQLAQARLAGLLSREGAPLPTAAAGRLLHQDQNEAVHTNPLQFPRLHFHGITFFFIYTILFSCKLKITKCSPNTVSLSVHGSDSAVSLGALEAIRSITPLLTSQEAANIAQQPGQRQWAGPEAGGSTNAGPSVLSLVSWFQLRNREFCHHHIQEQGPQRNHETQGHSIETTLVSRSLPAPCRSPTPEKRSCVGCRVKGRGPSLTAAVTHADVHRHTLAHTHTYMHMDRHMHGCTPQCGITHRHPLVCRHRCRHVCLRALRGSCSSMILVADSVLVHKRW